MCHADLRMGLVYTHEQKVDSVLFAYKEAAWFAEVFPAAHYILPIALWNVCDIYIQIEEYDAALSFLSCLSDAALPGLPASTRRKPYFLAAAMRRPTFLRS